MEVTSHSTQMQSHYPDRQLREKLGKKRIKADDNLMTPQVLKLNAEQGNVSYSPFNRN